MIKKTKNFHSTLETLRHKTIPITFHYNFVGEKTIYYIIGIGVIGIGIGRYENYHIGILSVSADMKKKLIGRTLSNIARY